jgi:hypothetical protein
MDEGYIMIDLKTHVLFRANEPSVVYELFDDEVVVVNLDSGNYYSLEHEAADIWRGLVSGVGLDPLMALLAERYATTTDAVATYVLPFVQELVAEGLLESVTTDADPAVMVALPTRDTPRPFTQPSFSRYSDMQQLLLLDPIHEVDAGGWPHAKPE